jgi:hypothetical protein
MAAKVMKNTDNAKALPYLFPFHQLSSTYISTCFPASEETSSPSGEL